MNYFSSSTCPSMNTGVFEQQFPVGMAYVPWQEWRSLYEAEKGFHIGTIFEELDKPFKGIRMGGCCR